MRSICILLICAGCQEPRQTEVAYDSPHRVKKEAMTFEDSIKHYFSQHPESISDGFDYAVGKPEGRGYYNAQPFGRNRHLGDDWNAVTGGNSDLGDPIYAIGHGIVVESINKGGGWGNVMRIVHCLPGDDSQLIESLYAHCDTLLMRKGQSIQRGDQIATIGTAGGQYFAHLHLEIRTQAGLPLGGGYGIDTTHHVSPTQFIDTHRPSRHASE